MSEVCDQLWPVTLHSCEIGFHRELYTPLTSDCGGTASHCGIQVFSSKV